ncbi:MAG: hypothetical protein SFX74_05890 [Fimbriimonadaceae bacterium]|nr:hypothetical protein [Fimbriimonadaceae bacterium]
MARKVSVGAIIAVGLALSTFAYAYWKLKPSSGDTRNYRIVWKQPSGSKAMPHGPQTLFLYRNEKHGYLLRGAQNQIVAEVNPTPDLDSKRLAQYYIDRTDENLKEWTAVDIGKSPGKNVNFHLIHRKRKDKTVVTAFGVSGNTTLIVSLSSTEPTRPEISEARIAEFRDYLATIEFQPAPRYGEERGLTP